MKTTPDKALALLREKTQGLPTDRKIHVETAKIILADAKKSGKHWVASYEVVGEYEMSNGAKVFCSHRMPARLSDLSVYYPDEYESANIGKGMKAYRKI